MRAALLATSCFAAICFFSTGASAQTEKQFDIWAGFFTTGQIHADAPSLTTWLDVQGRRGGDGTTAILRPGLGYVIKPWVSLWLGYAWIPEFIDATGERIDEHRIWEQLILEYKSEGILFQSRTRFEQRFRSNAVAHRFRQVARFNYQPKPSIPAGLVIWDELFLGIKGNTWAKQGFDQNRLFIGPAVFAIDGVFRAEVGYQFNYLSRAASQIVHVLAVNLFVNVKGKH